MEGQLDGQVDGHVDGAQGWVGHESEVPEERWGPPGPGAVAWRTLLSGDRTPSSGLTLGIAEIAPGAPDVGHLHRHDQVEAYLVLDGEGALDLSGVTHHVAAGSVVFVPSRAWHTVRNTGPGVLRLAYVFAADSFDEVVYEFADERGT